MTTENIVITDANYRDPVHTRRLLTTAATYRTQKLATAASREERMLNESTILDTFFNALDKIHQKLAKIPNNNQRTK